MPVDADVVPRRRDLWLRAMPCILLIAALAATAATSWSVRPHAGLRRASLGQLEVKESAESEEPVKCGGIEWDVDYPDNNFLGVPDVSTAATCQDVCEAEDKCMAWTWGAWNVCYLKTLWAEDSAKPVAHNRVGTSSGVSQRGCRAAGRRAGSEVVRGPRGRHGQDLSSGPSLFCFAHAREAEDGRRERELLALQAKDRAGIFACEAHAVYSRTRFSLADGLHSTLVRDRAHSEFDSEGAAGRFDDLLEEVWPISAAWRRLIADGLFQRHSWTVKVDPDAVFMPLRLRAVLARHPEYESSKGAYVNNCQLGLRKSLEVLSRNAVAALGMGMGMYGDGSGQCAGKLEGLRYLCPGGSCPGDEDKFLEQCLVDVLGVVHRDEYGILADEQCMPPAGWWSCQDPKAAAFSRFRTVADFRRCLDGATAASTLREVAGGLAAEVEREIAESMKLAETWTSTSTNTTTTLTTTTTTLDPFSLFCFSVMMPSGMELSLIRNQLSQGASIFGCDRWSVYSSELIWLSPGPPSINAVKLDLDFHPPTHVAGALTATWLNTGNFVKAWDAVIEDSSFWLNSWAVKVDPDAVFFPARLRDNLRKLDTKEEAVYIRNCPMTFGFYGALEVVSRKAVGAYSWGKERCLKDMDHHLMGEDMFMKRCLDFIGVREVVDYEVLNDGYCGAQPSPCNSGRAAFHPLKSWEQYSNCMSQAQAAPPDRTVVVMQ